MSRNEELPALSDATCPVPWDRLIGLVAHSSVGQLLNGIGHELNNALTSILGYAQLLQENGVTEQEHQTYVRVIVAGAEEISRTVEAMLVFARRQLGELDLLNFNDLVKQTVALQRYEVVKRGIAVELQLDRNLPVTVIDPYDMQIMLLTITQNAIEALAESTHNRTMIISTAGALPDTDRLSIEVADNGPGIPPHLLERVFEPFFTTKPGANGFGLTVCRYLAQKHDGTVAIQSRFGEGAKVRIELPIKTDWPDTLPS